MSLSLGMATLALQGFALVGGTVHSQVPGSEPQVQDIWVLNDRIAGIGPDLDLPPDCERVDVSGLHIVPGLIDGMINHDPEHDALYLAAGVTLCRDTGNDLASIVLQKRADQRDRVPGPDLYICGQVFDGLQSASTDALRLLNGQVVPEVLQQLFEALERSDSRIDYISFLQTIPKDSWQVLLQEARKRGLAVWGPIPDGVTLSEVIEGGQAGLLGLQWVLPPGTDWRTWQPEHIHRNGTQLREAQVGVTPLLSVYGRMLAQPDRDEALALVGPFYESGWIAEAEAWSAALEGEQRAALEGVVENQGELLRMLHEAGVPLVPGSAAPNAWLLPGQSLVMELEAWGRAGIPRKDVLAYATREAARHLGVLSERGTLEGGKIADLVVLGSDPTQSLTALRQPQLVVQRGRLFERKDLLERLDALRERQAGIRADLAQELEVPAPTAQEGDLVAQGLAETWTLGSRLCVEHFMVRRLGPDRWLYATRMVYPRTAVEPAKEVHLAQVMEGNLMERFDLRISAVGAQTVLDANAPESGAPQEGPQEGAQEGAGPKGESGGGPNSHPASAQSAALPQGILQVRGRRVSGTKIMNIEHRKDGVFLSSLRARNALTSVDVSLVLNAMVTARHCPDGPSFVVAFEGSALEPITDQWTVSVRERDRLLQVRTSRGALAFGLGPKGELHFAGRERGTSQMHVLMLGELKTFGGPGLALPQERVFLTETLEGQGTDEADGSDPAGGK